MWNFLTVNEMYGHEGQENESYRRPTSGSMKGAQNDNHRVKIMRMGTQLFIIYDPSKAASQGNHHMQRALPTHVSACSLALLLWWAGPRKLSRRHCVKAVTLVACRYSMARMLRSLPLQN